jgi:hypothetical protein
VSRFILIVAGIVMSLVVFLQVVFRFFIKIPLPWSEELSRYLMVWVGMMGASLALYEGRHIGVDLLMGRLRGWVRRVLMTAAILAVIWFLWLLVREGAGLALQNYSQLSPAMMIPMLLPTVRFRGRSLHADPDLPPPGPCCWAKESGRSGGAGNMLSTMGWFFICMFWGSHRLLPGNYGHGFSLILICLRVVAQRIFTGIDSFP